MPNQGVRLLRLGVPRPYPVGTTISCHGREPQVAEDDEADEELRVQGRARVAL